MSVRVHLAGEVNPALMGGMCRFYEREYPDLEETVMVNVKRIAEMGAYVQVRIESERGAVQVIF